jgi:hypothetical protein
MRTFSIGATWNPIKLRLRPGDNRALEQEEAIPASETPIPAVAPALMKSLRFKSPIVKPPKTLLRTTSVSAKAQAG